MVVVSRSVTPGQVAFLLGSIPIFIAWIYSDSECLEYKKSSSSSKVYEFGGLLFYFYIRDRTSLFPDSTKSYNRDLFLFLIIASAITSLKKHQEKSAFFGKSTLS